MAIKYTNIFHYKTLPNLPKMGFLVWKYTIWQPWSMLLLDVFKLSVMYIKCALPHAFACGQDRGAIKTWSLDVLPPHQGDQICL
jgi:hypothetical protein